MDTKDDYYLDGRGKDIKNCRMIGPRSSSNVALIFFKFKKIQQMNFMWHMSNMQLMKNMPPLSFLIFGNPSTLGDLFHLFVFYVVAMDLSYLFT